MGFESLEKYIVYTLETVLVKEVTNWRQRQFLLAALDLYHNPEHVCGISCFQDTPEIIP